MRLIIGFLLLFLLLCASPALLYATDARPTFHTSSRNLDHQSADFYNVDKVAIEILIRDHEVVQFDEIAIFGFISEDLAKLSDALTPKIPISRASQLPDAGEDTLLIQLYFDGNGDAKVDGRRSARIIAYAFRKRHTLDRSPFKRAAAFIGFAPNSPDDLFAPHFEMSTADMSGAYATEAEAVRGLVAKFARTIHGKLVYGQSHGGS